jgi:hypothetical protein
LLHLQLEYQSNTLLLPEEAEAVISKAVGAVPVVI